MVKFRKMRSPEFGGVFKWVALGCGGALIILIGAGVGLYYLIQKNFSFNPQQAEIIAQSLFDYEIPGGSQGLYAMNLFGTKIVLLADTKEIPEVFFIVGSIPGQSKETGEQIQKSFQETIEQSLKEQNNQSIQYTSQRTENKQLCQKTVPVLIKEGQLTVEGQSSSIAAVNYMTFINYQNTERFVWLMASGNDAQKKVETVFNSLKCK
jgi:hypothetical protein